MTKWKLGVVSYLNSLPLYRRSEMRGEIETARALPALLAQQLDAGTVDAALLPIVDHLRGHGDGLVSDAIIGATGEVRSVLMFARQPFAHVQSVAADTSSHTSVALLQVLLRELYGTLPPFVPAPPDLDEMLRAHEAALIIGDPALEAVQHPGDLLVLDLAEGWQRLTGLPFVFAGWVARRGLSQGQREELAATLSAQRDDGCAHVAQLVEENSTQSVLPAAVRTSYLTEAIEYRLTPRHAEAIELLRAKLDLG